MKISTLIAAAAMSLAAGVAGSALAANQSESGKFITEAIQGNLGEVNVEKLAQDKGASPQVKSFGAMLTTDHTDANQKANEAAVALRVSAPTKPGPKQKEVSDELSKLSGAQFDRRFTRLMIEDHKKDIAEYEKASKADDAAGKYARDVLPTLRKHLQAAEQLPGPAGRGRR